TVARDNKFRDGTVSEFAISEDYVQKLWAGGFFNNISLRSDKGLRVKIQKSGIWNKNSGPDFRNSIIDINGKEILTDVEIHLSSEDWYHHGHHLNPDYNSVGLHVVMESRNDAETRNYMGRRVPQVFLRSLLNEKESHILDGNIDNLNLVTQSVINYTTNCNLNDKSIDVESFQKYLEDKGLIRIYGKVNRIKRRVASSGYEQALYEGIMQSFGFGANKYPFLILAGKLDIRKIRRILLGYPGRKRFIVCLSLMLGCARLLQKESNDFNIHIDLEGSFLLRECEDIWRKHRDSLISSMLEESSFSYDGVRPISNPFRSLIGISNILSKCIDKNLFNTFSEIFISSNSNLRVLYDYIDNMFNAGVNDIWLNRYSFEDKASKTSRLIGKERINRIIGNILVPLLLLKSLNKKNKIDEKAILELAQKTPGNPNKYTRYIISNLPIQIRNILKLSFIIEQGLLYHYENMCSYSRCERCGMNLSADK
ncbi:MAG: DUF2851 family protein, partial [Acidobacteria bacterium]|nr:DUF2851 family protein [Acidobacteriota bacterium]